jgi:hypothetical protein
LCWYFYLQICIWDKKGVTGRHQAGAARPAGAIGPAGAAGPAPCHDPRPGDHDFHKHTLDGEDSPWLCQFDPNGVEGSTWIHRPTSACIQPPLRINPEHSLPVAVHHTALSRYDRTKRYGCTYKIWNPAEPTQGTDSQPTKEQASGPSTTNAVDRRCGRAWLPPPQLSNRPPTAIKRTLHLLEQKTHRRSFTIVHFCILE